MAFDCFLKIDGIPGESTDEKHKDWLEPLSFRFGVSHQVTGSLSGGGSQFSERANFDTFQIEKVIDASTPKLFLFCCKGTPIPKMTFELCRATGEKTCYEKIEFENCHVQSFKSSGTPDKGAGLPTEEISFTFSKKTIEAFKTDHATAKLLGSAGKAFWDQTKNTGA